jgi:hypothetical protein
MAWTFVRILMNIAKYIYYHEHHGKAVHFRNLPSPIFDRKPLAEYLGRDKFSRGPPVLCWARPIHCLA